MSLTSIINTSAARKYLKDKIHNPGIDPEPDTVVTPEAESPHRVGMAFDYALRAGLEARFNAVTRRSIAEAGLLTLRVLTRGENDHPHISTAKHRVERASTLLANLGTRQALPVQTARACYHLAGMDVVFRARQIDQVDRKVTGQEIRELQKLYELIPWEDFEPNEHLYLNPTFGKASHAVGGADADVVIDNMVVELKTIKRQRPKISMFRQLVGYALFAQRYGMNREGMQADVDRVAIYFSRAGELRTWPLSEILDLHAADKVVEYLMSFHERIESDWENKES